MEGERGLRKCGEMDVERRDRGKEKRWRERGVVGRSDMKNRDEMEGSEQERRT